MCRLPCVGVGVCLAAASGGSGPTLDLGGHCYGCAGLVCRVKSQQLLCMLPPSLLWKAEVLVSNGLS